MFIPCLVIAKDISVRILDKGQKSGVKSELYHVDQLGKQRRYGVTNDYGNITIAIGKSGERYKIIPFSKSYFSLVVECPIRSKLQYVARINYYFNKELKNAFLEKSPSHITDKDNRDEASVDELEKSLRLNIKSKSKKH
jgi:hypothetical protein